MNELEAKTPLFARVLNPLLSVVRDAQAYIPNSRTSWTAMRWLRSQTADSISGCFLNFSLLRIFAKMLNHLKNELHNVISGKSQVRYGATIQAVANYLSNGSQSSPKAQDSKQVREQEAKRLEFLISEKNLWIKDIDFSQYVSEGAEQRVYLKDSDHVLKLNDAIYYSYWKDYFHNLLLHNFFFTDTAYELIGFTKVNKTLYAIVQQSYVKISQSTDLAQVKTFLESNGFINNRNNDYINPDLGIILEDLHDENVLTRNDILYFIDTVFYLKDEFWSTGS